MGNTVADLIPIYLKHRKQLGEFSQGTSRCARSALGSFSRHCGKRRIENIGATHIEGWLRSMEHLAPSYRRARLSMVRRFFTWAVRQGRCKRNPAVEVRGPKQPRTIPRALSAEAIQTILEHCPDSRARFVIVCMAQQGLRCCEVARLTIGDLDLNHGTMRISGKGGHERILPIMDETLTALYDYLGDFPASAGPLVRSYVRCQRALTAATISTLVSGWMRDAGVKLRSGDGISAHAQRHSCATHMLVGGAHVRDVQFALGHAHLSTTERYLPHVVHGLREAMEGRTYRG